MLCRCVVVVLDDEQPLHRLVDELARSCRTSRRALPSITGFSRYAIAPALSPCWRSRMPVMMCTGMCRVSRMVLEPVEHAPAVHARHVDVERDGVGMECVRELEAGVAVERDEALEALLARHVEQDLREVRLVLDDEHDAVAGLDLFAIVLERRGQRHARRGHRRDERRGRFRRSARARALDADSTSIASRGVIGVARGARRAAAIRARGPRAAGVSFRACAGVARRSAPGGTA